MQVAGSAIAHDGLQVSEARLLGVPVNERASWFAYDARSRASVFATRYAKTTLDAIPGSAFEALNAADFRNAQERTSQLTSQVRSNLFMYESLPKGFAWQ